MTALSKLIEFKPSISGCWENREGLFICRWIICWGEFDGTHVGAIAGYSGGGSFQLEKFYVTQSQITLSLTDNYSNLSEQIVSFGEDAQDIILEYHDEDTWFDSDSLYLNDSSIDSMRQENDLLLLDAIIPDRLHVLFDKVGLTARPSYFK